MKKKKILIVDGHSIMNRAYYAMPHLTNSEGKPTGAILGFLNILFRFLDEQNPEYLIVTFDTAAPTFRHKMFADYKGTRKPMDEELHEQIAEVKELLPAMGIQIRSLEGFEADDLMGTLAVKAAGEGLSVTILSGDRDLLQLAAEDITVRIPKTREGKSVIEDYGPEQVKEVYGVTPKEFIDEKALMGDSSDNIPGAPGIGPKTASKLIQQYHSVEEVIAHAQELKPDKVRRSVSENTDKIRMSYDLSKIRTDAPVELNLDEAATGDYFNEKSYPYFKKYDFKKYLSRFAPDDSAQNSRRDLAARRLSEIKKLEDADTLFRGLCQALSDGKWLGADYLISNGRVVGLALAPEEGETNYFLPTSGYFNISYLAQKMIELTDAASDRNLCFLDLKGQLGAFTDLYIGNLRKEAMFDVSVGDYLLYPARSAYTSDVLAGALLDMPLPSLTERAKAAGKKKEEELAPDDPARIEDAVQRAWVSMKTAGGIRKSLKETGMYDLFENIEMPLIFVLYDMEKTGIRIDADSLKSYSEGLGKKIDALTEKIYSEAHKTFNINSPKQLGTVLFEDLKIPNGKKTKSGYSTSAEVLEKLAPDYPIVADILEYRTYSKLKSTYADGLPQYIDSDGRIRCHFNQMVTATGRISSSDPNLQNIPVRQDLGREIRRMFIPRDGYSFIDADYSQIELRIMAHMSGDEKLIEAYRSAKDIHRITASQVFHVPFDEVTPQQRRNAKAVNFGIIYGISSFGLSKDLSISRNDAKHYIDQYFKTFPKVKQYIDQLVASAKKNGYSVTMFGRRRPIPELKDSNFMRRQFGERVAMNAPIQGTAADIMKIAMNRVHESLAANHMHSRIVLQVHDELLIETTPGEEEAVRQILTECMMHAADLKVPLEIDISEGKNWAEAH
ncbi:MAG: DNA polymerase I [Lachnospiraceae bacterium]